MGCKGSKASAPQSATTPAKSTLLDAPAQKKAVEGNESLSFTIFMDMKKGISNEYLAIAEDETMLQICDVEGGPIGLWNNRARTEKVRTGDCVVRVRKVGWTDAQWVANDAKEILKTLMADATFEVEIKRGAETPERPEEPVQEVAPKVKEEEKALVEANAETTVDVPEKANTSDTVEVLDTVVAAPPVDSQAEPAPEAAEEAPPPLQQTDEAPVVEAKGEGVVEAEAEVKSAGCGICAK